MASQSLRGAVHGHCLGMLVLCDCLDVSYSAGGHVNARKRGVFVFVFVIEHCFFGFVLECEVSGFHDFVNWLSGMIVGSTMKRIELKSARKLLTFYAFLVLARLAKVLTPHFPDRSVESRMLAVAAQVAYLAECLHDCFAPFQSEAPSLRRLGQKA